MNLKQHLKNSLEESVDMEKHDDTQAQDLPPLEVGKFSWHNHEFRARILSAIVLVPLVLATIAAGGVWFYALILATAILMIREWDRFVTHRENISWKIGGVVYVLATCLSLLLLREEALGGGLSVLLYLLLIVWATDIGAYFAGRLIGGPKLIPAISPNKTWAGLLGGILAAMTVGGILSFLFPFPQHFVQGAWLSALLAVVAQAGDFFESWMKRKADLKDSGHLIPGHGGILDRIDGLTFTAPLLALFYHLV